MELSFEFSIDSSQKLLIVKRLETEAFFSKLLSLIESSKGLSLEQFKKELSKLINSLWLVEEESFLISECVKREIEKVNLCKLSFKKRENSLEVRVKFELIVGRNSLEFRGVFITSKYLNGDLLFKALKEENEADFVKELISQGENFAVLVVDIQDFSKINDVFGIVNGDKILNDVLKRLKHKFEGERCKVFRSHSDKFILVCREGKKDVLNLVEEVLSVFNHPFEVEGEKLYLSANVGVAFFPEHGRNVISKAEIAQREAVKRKRPFLIFSAELDVPNKVIEILTKVKDDLKEGRIEVFFQPKVELQTFKIVGAEALMRCSVPPADAIPVIVEYGLMYDVGKKILEKSFYYTKLLEDKNFRVPISVNVSYIQLADRQFVRFVKKLLNKYSLEGNRFIFEITESEASLDDECIVETISQLRKMGIGISIDDFGKGYSSLSRLKFLKACELKIDRAFIKDVDKDPEILSIVKFAVDVASLLSMRTVAEGIERKGQVPILRRVGCSEGQGFLFSPPVEFKKFVELLKKGYLRPKGVK